MDKTMINHGIPIHIQIYIFIECAIIGKVYISYPDILK